MPKTDLHPTAIPAAAGTAGDTDELAWELQQQRPDTHRIAWLIQDMGADIAEAMRKANLKREDLLRNPLLRPFLKKHLH